MRSYTETISPTTPVIYFDGECALCNACVDFVIEKDLQQIFLFSSLRSEYATARLPQTYVGNCSTLVLEVDGQFFTKTEAVVGIGKRLGGMWTALAILLSLIPNCMADVIYDWVAKHRYRFFGKRSCRVPTGVESNRFL